MQVLEQIQAIASNPSASGYDPFAALQEIRKLTDKAVRSERDRQLRRAYRQGQESAGRDYDNPYDPADSELAIAYDEGREAAEDEASDSYACSLDPSMRDTHGVDI